MNGTKTTKVTDGVILNCISEEASELLDEIMQEWDAWLGQLRETLDDPTYEPSHYGFAYWLVRYSGLVEPAP